MTIKYGPAVLVQNAKGHWYTRYKIKGQWRSVSFKYLSTLKAWVDTNIDLFPPKEDK